MSKLYAVIQVMPELHYDYKTETIRESFSVGLPYVFDDKKEAYQSAKAKLKANVPCFVKEFPHNPKDSEIEDLKKKLEEYDSYIQWLASVYVPEKDWGKVYDEMTKMGIDYRGANDV